MVDGSAFPVGVEVASLHYGADLRDVMVRWDGDVACGKEGLRSLPGIVEADGDAPCPVDAGNDEGRGLDELELELRSSLMNL